MSCSPLCPSHGLCWLRQGMPEQWLWVPGRFRGIVCRPGGGVAPEVGGHEHRRSGGPGPSAARSPGTGGGCQLSLSPQLGPGSPPGVWVCSTDMLLSVPPSPGEPAEVFGGLPACLRPFCLSSPTCHLGLARCPCRKGALRFSGWSLEQEAGLPRHASLCCPWGGGTQSCPFGLQGLRGRALGGEVLSPGEHPCWKPRKRPFSRGACTPLP